VSQHGAVHAAGATVLAHENTWKRMSEPHDLPILYRDADGVLHDLHFDPSPAEALPQQTFPDGYANSISANLKTISRSDAVANAARRGLIQL